jgi:hypothetical protein
MYAMQYEIGLPADYDMEIIRERVRTRGALLDSLSGLGLKAYCVRERGNHGSPVNAYAPFYLWNRTTAMSAFLTGAGFRGLCDSFGRPVVRHWMGIGFALGSGQHSAPEFATRSVELIAADAEVGDVAERAVAELGDHVKDGNAHSAAIAIDPRRWELVRFTLWRSMPAAGAGVSYRVLHVSAPGLSDLAA